MWLKIKQRKAIGSTRSVCRGWGVYSFWGAIKEGIMRR